MQHEYKPIPLLLRPLQWIYCIYAIVSFCILMLIIFPIVIVAASLGRIRGGNIVTNLCRLWGNVWLPMIGIFHRNIYEDKIDDDKQYVFIANHISYMDIPLIFQGIRKKHFRILAKIEMSRIPVFGFLYRNATVMVDRGDPAKRSRSIMELKRFMKHDISIFIYPEGTFNETDQPLKSFYDGAFRLAVETQTPLKPIVFPDTLARMHYHSAFTLTPGSSRAIILPEISVEGLTVSDVPALKERAQKVMTDCLLKYQRH